jgi:uncharacterized protein GlcG (DUF336 family)
MDGGRVPTVGEITHTCSLTHVVPFLVEDDPLRLGATFERLAGWQRSPSWTVVSLLAKKICTATIEGGRMSNEKIGSAAGASRALQPTETNPLDFVPDKIPFDTPYGPPISPDRAQAIIHAALTEAKKRNWKMNVAVVDSAGNLVAFQRMDGAMLASIQIAEHKARAAATFRRETKVFEDGINLMHLNYLLAFDGIIASRGGIPLIEKGSIIGAIGVSGGADSQDEIVSKAGAAVINELPATNK